VGAADGEDRAIAEWEAGPSVTDGWLGVGKTIEENSLPALLPTQEKGGAICLDRRIC
jgi:hypothetical protein